MQTKAAERMRRMRARRKAGGAVGNILFERSDWRLFTDPRTLPQKAGREPDQIGCVILKELVDNALDTGAAEVRLDGDDTSCVVSDNGPGLDAATVLRVFEVNRPLVSSKLQRLPTRGMLGNGLRVVMGAVAAYDGKISVTTRGQRYDLAHNSVTGATEICVASPAPARRGSLSSCFFRSRCLTRRISSSPAKRSAWLLAAPITVAPRFPLGTVRVDSMSWSLRPPRTLCRVPSSKKFSALLGSLRIPPIGPRG